MQYVRTVCECRVLKAICGSWHIGITNVKNNLWMDVGCQDEYVHRDVWVCRKTGTLCECRVSGTICDSEHIGTRNYGYMAVRNNIKM